MDRSINPLESEEVKGVFEVKVPELAESVTEGTIVSWFKKEGEFVQEGDVLLELETDKVNLEISAEQSGVLQKILKTEGETVHVGEVIAHIQQGEEGKVEEEKKDNALPKHKQENEEREISVPGSSPIASPSVRRWAREHGIDLSQYPQGPFGRFKSEDAKEEKSATEEETTSNKVPKEKTTSVTDEAQRPVERQRMSRRRQTIASRLLQAKQSTAMLTTFNEVDMSKVMELRQRRKEAFFEKHGVKLGFMSFFTKAVIGALKEFPMLNAEIQGDEVLIKKYYDIGIAVATDEGLVVPVIRNADRLSFADIERQIATLAEKARNKTLSLEEITGGTFTITNGGVFGSLFSTPILNTPQVGILGMHAIQKRPVTLSDGSIESRPMMYIALSYDHRLIDGREAVQFLVRIKEMIEDPECLLLEG